MTGEQAVAMRDVSYHYGAVRAVNGLDLTIRTGEIVSLLGPNGAGKSTSIGLLLGLLTPAAGTVSLFGTSPTRAVGRGKVGAMLQENRLLPRATIRELMEFLHGLYPKPLPVDEVLDLADLTSLQKRTVERLSGGQAQRVRFAMALVGQPDLLVLDEPTAALDVEARRDFWIVMRRYASGGRTVLFSTHYLEEADDNADRIVVIAGGSVIADGTPADIKRLVPGRQVSIRLPGVPAEQLTRLDGVASVEVRNERVYLSSTDSDATVLALASAGWLRDLEVTGADLEEAFVTLTSATRQAKASQEETAR